MLGFAVLLCGAGGIAARDLWDSQALGFTAFALATAATFAAYRITLRTVDRRQRALLRRLEALAKGERPEVLPSAASRNADPLHAAVDRLSLRLAEQARRDAILQQRLEGLPEQVMAAMAAVEASADDQEAAVEETASLLAHLNASIRQINGEVDGLARSNEETAASIQQMGSAVEQVAQNAHSLQDTVESSTASIHEMSASIQRVAASGDEVQRVAQETATATTQMDSAIREVGEHVRGASTLTLKVSESAEHGSSAVRSTIQGIETIREQTLTAKGALEGLAERISEIGQIATVIGSVSDETNLLSLNASIIAAQAGEHGKAFAVVADQVKTLAQRTSASARQIEEMIRLVQAESGHAVRSMAAGAESVEEGVSRSRAAGDALDVIRESAGDASQQVEHIQRAAEEQARNSKHVADAARRVSEHVQHISQAMAEQSSASEHLLRNADLSLEMCRQMASALEEQRATGRYITGNSEAITGMIASIQGNTGRHEHTSGALSSRFESLLENAQRVRAGIPAVARIVKGLAERADEADEADAPDA